MKSRKSIFATVTTTLVVATAAAAWAVAGPTAISCAFAESQANIVNVPSESAAFVNAINSLRTSQGLNPLAIDGTMTSIAQTWANTMALSDEIFHRTDLRSGVTGDWSTLGENVGVGPTVSQLMDAFIASPGHYKNLVDPRFTHIGVGTVRTSNGQLYTAHEFVALRGAAPAVAAPAPVVHTPVTSAPRVRSVAAPRPVVTAPPTTVAPTTTVPVQLEAQVQRLAADKQLDDGSQHDGQQQQSKSDGRCRSHATQTLQGLVK